MSHISDGAVKVIEIIGISSKSFDDAVAQALDKAAGHPVSDCGPVEQQFPDFFRRNGKFCLFGDAFNDASLVSLAERWPHAVKICRLGHDFVAEVVADKVIMGIRALDFERGLTNDYLPETKTDRAILGIGREVIVVADHTKCGRVSTAFVAPITTIQKLVTDLNTSPDFIDHLTAKGIEVVTV